MATVICSVCKTDQPLSPDGNWVAIHVGNDDEIYPQCQGSGYPPYVDVKRSSLTMDEKQALLGDIENDLWIILKKTNDANAQYPEVTPLIQAIEQCRNIQMSFPTITFSKSFTNSETMLDEGHHYHEV